MKTKFIWGSILLMILAMVAQAQDSWTQKTSFPRGGRTGPFSFSIGNKGYAGCGTDDAGTFYADMWEFDPATNSWTQKADFGGGVRYLGTSFNINDKGYAGLGIAGSYDWRTDFWEFDPIANTWTRKNDFAGGPRYTAIGFSIGNFGYIGTGNYRISPAYPANYLNDFWQYEPTQDTWLRKADVPEQGRTNAFGFALGSKGYIGGGFYYYDTRKKDFYEYDPAYNRWTRKQDLPGTERYGAVCFTIGENGYVTTGWNYSGLNDLWQYNTVAESWSQKTSLPASERYVAASFSIGNKGYLGLGGNNAGALADVWEYSEAAIVPLPSMGFEPIAVTTLAGTGEAGFSNGAGSSAKFFSPSSVVCDKSGNIYVADKLNHRIRKVSPDGFVTTFAGNGQQGLIDGAGTAASFSNPAAVAIDAVGNLYVADQSNNAIRKISPTGYVTTIAGNGAAGFVNGNGAEARFNSPKGVTIDHNGFIFVADGNRVIRKITPDGQVSTYAGSGISGSVDGPAAGAQFTGPIQVAADLAGNLYVTDVYGPLRKISTAGIVSTLWTNYVGAFNEGVVCDSSGNVYVSTTVNGNTCYIFKLTKTGNAQVVAGGVTGFLDSTGAEARFTWPAGIAFDQAGNLYVADAGNSRIRKMSIPSLHLAAEAGHPSPAQNILIYYNDVPVTLQLNFPADFEGSASPDGSGPWQSSIAINSTTGIEKIPVRLKSHTLAGTYNGILQLTAAGIATKEMNVSGIVIDTTPASISCSSDRTLCFNKDRSYTLSPLVATDDAGIAGISFSITGATTRTGTGPDASGEFNPGLSSIRYVVTDVNNNTSVCSTSVRVDFPLTVSVPTVYPLLIWGEPNTLYKGFGPVTTTLTAMASGGTKLPATGYVYHWSTGATTRSIQVSPSDPGSWLYTVTVTDSLGCTAIGSITINVKDVRCGQKLNKVIVCWTSRYGNSESCVNENQAALALLFGAKLGSCSNPSSRIMQEPAPSDLSGFGIYPNPNTGRFVLQLRKLTNPILRIYDRNGLLVFTQRVNAGAETQQLVISLPQVANGLYLVQVVAREGIFSNKMLVQQ